mgnify:CR=1 FL=1
MANDESQLAVSIAGLYLCAAMTRLHQFIFLISIFIVAAATAFQPAETAPQTSEDLGRLLFEDPILSSDQSISCASCHIPAFAFSDTSAVSLGVGGQKGSRNTPARHFFGTAGPARSNSRWCNPLKIRWK